MARIFRSIFKNLFFMGKRILFFTKDPESDLDKSGVKKDQKLSGKEIEGVKEKIAKDFEKKVHIEKKPYPLMEESDITTKEGPADNLVTESIGMLKFLTALSLINGPFKSLNMKKAAIALLASGLAVNVLSGALYGIFHGVYSLGSIPTMFRPAMHSLDIANAILLGAFSFVICAMFIAGYAFFYNAIPGKGAKKGMIFGVTMWLLGIVLPLVHVYLAVNISFAVIAYWMFFNLTSYLLIGAITGTIYRPKVE